MREDVRPPEPQRLEGFPLSPQQARLWSVSRAAGDAFRAMALVEIEGPLDPRRLSAALGAVAARYEILRTGFRSLPGMSLPLQVIGRPEPSLTRIESLPAGADPAASLWKLAEAAPLAPEDGPVLSGWLAPAASGAHLLALALPALCCDAASLEGLVREVAEAWAAGESWQPGEEPLQYVDLAQALEDLLASEEAEAARAYWERHGPPGADERLPVGAAPGPPTGRFRPCPVPLASAGEVAASLAARLGIPVRAVLLAAWHALFLRLSGRALSLGVAFAGRFSEELHGAVGLLARHLPVRLEAAGQAGFADLARQAERTLRAHEERQELFAWDRMAPAEGFFPVCFDVRESGAPLPAGPDGARFRRVRLRVVHDRFVLRLAGLGTALELDRDADLVSEEEALRLGEHFEALLASAAASPEAAVDDLEILSPRQRRERLSALDGGPAPRPEACLHELVAAQAARTPGALAVEDETGALSYAELLERSGRLAARLRRLGVGPEVRVGVCVERSRDLLVALLGVLRAGGAYVPLDPSYPAERLAFMLADAAVPVVVTGGGAAGALPPHGAAEVRADDPTAWGEAEEPAGAAQTPDHLAYVLYTSGSTGRPKGVMVSHRAILNRLLWMQDRHPLAADDRVLQKTPASFDASIWEMFCPLLAGAAVVMARPGGHQDTAWLASAVAAQGITVLQLVPSLLRPFLDEPAAAGCRSLRRLFCGGEALAADLEARVAALLPQVRLVNLYGPTEAAIDVASWPCDGRPGAAVVPIGRPLPNVRLALLDDRARPVPPLVAGELAIGGVNLARGYLGRPGLTAERFVPDPFAAERGSPGERLFLTGDLALCRPDGTLDFLGRADHQVKLRGVRIELGEIEAALRLLPGVGECVAAVREERPGAQQLVAYVVPAADGAGRPLAAAALRAALARSLPELMLPAAYVLLSALPRLPNGKVDRAALPSPRPDERSRRAPAGPVEELLAGLWSEVLKVERVSAEDDFFALGGHSLVATQTLSRLREAFRIDLPMRALFQAPKLSDLAAVVEAELRSGATPVEPPVERVPRGGPLPVSFAQERLFFIDRLQPGGHAYNLPVVLRLAGPLAVPVLEAAWSEIRRRHESLRTTFLSERGVPVQRIAPPAPLSLPVVDLEAVPEPLQSDAWLGLVRREAALPFDLARGPLFRVFLVRLAAAEHVLFVSTHHIVSDAWSTGLLIRDLKALVGAFSEGRPSPLPELPFQYADYAQWERRWLAGGVLEAQLAWWKSRLAGAPGEIALPLDGPRPPVQTFRGGSLSRPLGGELTAALDALARREGATVYMVLLAAWKLLLFHLSEQDDLVVGTSVANRSRPELEGIVGFFVNLLPMRTGLRGSADFRGILSRVRETALGAFAHQGVPFATLVESLRLERDLSRNPVFQVVFTFENARGEPIDLPGLKVRPVAYGMDTTVFDIALIMWREDGDKGLSAALRYSSDLFLPATVDRLLDQLTALLEAVAARPDEPLAEIRGRLDEVAARHREARDRELEEGGLRKLRSVRRQTITTSNSKD